MATTDGGVFGLVQDHQQRVGPHRIEAPSAQRNFNEGGFVEVIDSEVFAMTVWLRWVIERVQTFLAAYAGVPPTSGT